MSPQFLQFLCRSRDLRATTTQGEVFCLALQNFVVVNHWHDRVSMMLLVMIHLVDVKVRYLELAKRLRKNVE